MTTLVAMLAMSGLGFVVSFLGMGLTVALFADLEPRGKPMLNFKQLCLFSLVVGVALAILTAAAMYFEIIKIL